jgi:hypothetical protein
MHEHRLGLVTLCPLPAVQGIFEELILSEQIGFFQGPNARRFTTALLIIGAIAVAYSLYANLRRDPSITAAESPLFVNVETGKTFHQPLVAGMMFPVKSPDTGNMSGYPAELCYWNKDGTPKTEPTAVALNSYLGKPEPTFCPDCGRLVVEHNPLPRPGVRPPPTREEYMAMHPGGADQR